MYFEIYLSGTGWNWRLKTANNVVLSQSAQDYPTQQACEVAVERVKEAAPMAEIRVDAALRSTLQEAFRRKAQQVER